MTNPYCIAGTMANLIAVMSHCDTRGSEAIVGSHSHVVVYEQGGISTIAGVNPRVVQTQMVAGRETPVGGMNLLDIEQVGCKPTLGGVEGGGSNFGWFG